MAVGIDSFACAGLPISTGSSPTTGTTTTSAGDTLLVAFIHAYIGEAYSGPVASAVTWNGTAMTRLTSINWPGTPIFDDDLWYLFNPAIGTSLTLSATFNTSVTGNPGWQGGTILVSAFTGANAIGTLQNSNSASSTSQSIASLSGTSGASDLYLTFGNCSNASNSLTGSGNMTNANYGSNGGAGNWSIDTIAGTATGNAATYSQAGSANYFIIGALPILASAAPTSTASVAWIT